MRLTKWIDSLLNPTKTNLKDGALEDIVLALDLPAVRRLWVKNLIDEIWKINVKVDHLMEDNSDFELRKLSQRRNAIVFCLNEILTAKDEIDSEYAEQERQNRILESFRGTAAQLPKS